MFNRSLVVDLSHYFSEEDAVAIRRRLGVPAEAPAEGRKPYLADFLFDREGPGILNWALEGLDRLLKRGMYDIPASVGAAIQRFKDESNSVAEFARTMLVQSPDTKVNRADLICAFHGWLKEEAGDAAKMHSARWLIPKLRNACPWAIPRKMKGVRYFCGVRLTGEAAQVLVRASQRSSAVRPWQQGGKLALEGREPAVVTTYGEGGRRRQRMTPHQQ